MRSRSNLQLLRVGQRRLRLGDVGRARCCSTIDFNRGVFECTPMLGGSCSAGVSSTSWGIIVSPATFEGALVLTSTATSLVFSPVYVDTTGYAGSEGRSVVVPPA